MSNALELTLRQAYEELIENTNLQDIEGVLSHYHNQSYARAEAQQFLERSMDIFVLKVTILKFFLVGTDGTFAYCKTKQKVEKVSGPESPDTIAELLIACRQQGEVWKIWNQFMLTNEPVGLDK